MKSQRQKVIRSPAERFATVQLLLNDKKIEQAYPSLVLLAEESYAPAQLQLGLLCAKGELLVQDDVSAVRWFRAAARQGEMLAYYNLGLMYDQGRGVAQNIQEALYCYRVAAEQGKYVLAQYNLAHLYTQGADKSKTTDEQAKEAARWFLAAAEQQDPLAQVNLGLLYAQGKGVERDEKAALMWYRHSADQRCSLAQYQLGLLYAKGQGGVDRHDAVALSWFHAAAEQKYAPACYQMGLFHAQGKGGVEPNPFEAMRWFRLSAKQGYALAQYNLGILYRDGCGVTANVQQAQHWFKRAAASKEPVGLLAQTALEELEAFTPQLPAILPLQSSIQGVVVKPALQRAKLKKGSSHILPPSNSSSSFERPLSSLTHGELTWVRDLKRGRWGSVYQATWFGVPVLVKQLSPLPQAIKADFESQAERLVTLQFPTLVRTYGVIHEAPLSLVMEYLPSDSLSHVLSKQSFSWVIRTRMALHVASAVAFLHQHGVLHGALTSENVWVSDAQEVKLVDGGWPDVAAGARTAWQGLIPSMAPERFQAGTTGVTVSSEVYALGILFWEIATGGTPYATLKGDRAIREAVCAGQRELIPQAVPSFLKQLIERCWAHNPQDRPTLAQIVGSLEAGFDQLKRQQTVTVPPCSHSKVQTVSTLPPSPQKKTGVQTPRPLPHLPSFVTPPSSPVGSISKQPHLFSGQGSSVLVAEPRPRETSNTFSSVPMSPTSQGISTLPNTNVFKKAM